MGLGMGQGLPLRDEIGNRVKCVAPKWFRADREPIPTEELRAIDGEFSVALSIPAVQRALKEDALDAWLLNDFHGSNPIARRIAGLDDGSKMTTRRWFYVIPASGEPRKLVHAIEPHNLDHLREARPPIHSARPWRRGFATCWGASNEWRWSIPG